MSSFFNEIHLSCLCPNFASATRTNILREPQCTNFNPVRRKYAIIRETRHNQCTTCSPGNNYNDRWHCALILPKHIKNNLTTAGPRRIIMPIWFYYIILPNAYLPNLIFKNPAVAALRYAIDAEMSAFSNVNKLITLWITWNFFECAIIPLKKAKKPTFIAPSSFRAMYPIRNTLALKTTNRALFKLIFSKNWRKRFGRYGKHLGY